MHEIFSLFSVCVIYVLFLVTSFGKGVSFRSSIIPDSMKVKNHKEFLNNYAPNCCQVNLFFSVVRLKYFGAFYDNPSPENSKESASEKLRAFFSGLFARSRLCSFLQSAKKDIRFKK